MRISTTVHRPRLSMSVFEERRGSSSLLSGSWYSRKPVWLLASPSAAIQGRQALCLRLVKVCCERLCLFPLRYISNLRNEYFALFKVRAGIADSRLSARAERGLILYCRCTVGGAQAPKTPRHDRNQAPPSPPYSP